MDEFLDFLKSLKDHFTVEQDATPSPFVFGDVVRIKEGAFLVMEDQKNFILSMKADEGMIGVVTATSAKIAVVQCRHAKEYSSEKWGFSWSNECLERIGHISDLLPIWQLSHGK